MIDRKTSLRHEFFQIAETQTEPQIHRPRVTITCGSNFRVQNNGGRHNFMMSRYHIRNCNTSGQANMQMPIRAEF